MTDAAYPLLSVVPCLDCGKKGRHKHIGYASSRAMTETGKLCNACYKRIMETRHSRGWYVWPSQDRM